MAEIRHLENRYDVIFFCQGWFDLDKISETGAEWHVNCVDVVKIETRCRIPIWRTLGRIQWHVIPEPPATLKGAATWWIHCHHSRASRHRHAVGFKGDALRQQEAQLLQKVKHLIRLVMALDWLTLTVTTNMTYVNFISVTELQYVELRTQLRCVS